MLRNINNFIMTSKLAGDHKTRRLLILCAALLLMSGSVFALVRLNPGLKRFASMQSANEISVTVREGGCEPARVTRSPGQVRLTVTNETNVQGLTLQLYRSNGALVRETSIEQGSTSWSDVVNLEAGSYTLIADHNPAWTFNIQVQ